MDDDGSDDMGDKDISLRVIKVISIFRENSLKIIYFWDKGYISDKRYSTIFL